MVGVGVIRPQGRIIRDFAEAKSTVEPDHPAYGRIIQLSMTSVGGRIGPF